MDEVEKILRDAGYKIADVPVPESGKGCMVCGKKDVESVAGVCIQCAVRDAPRHWP